MKDVYITAFGSYLPGKPITNDQIENYIGLIFGKASRYKSASLRQNRIKTRYYALSEHSKNPFISSAEMASKALLSAFSKAETLKSKLSFLSTSCTLGDMLVPGLASHVHALLGIKEIEIAHHQSVCASAIMAIKNAYLNIKACEHKCAAVTGSEFASRYFTPGNYENVTAYQNTQEIPFEADFLRFTLSDGAGAMILEDKPNQHGLSLKILWIDIRSFAHLFPPCMVAGAVFENDKWRSWSEFDSHNQAINAGSLVLIQDFDLMKRMLPIWVSHYLDLIQKDKIIISEVDHVCSHYSSHSLKEDVMLLLEKAGSLIDPAKWFTNLYTKGNTGAASIFIMLEELFQSGKLKKGEKILCHIPESGRCLNGFMLLEVV